MANRRTQKPITVSLNRDRKEQLDELIDQWSTDQKKFMLQALIEYSPPILKPTKSRQQKVKEFFIGKEKKEDKKGEIEHLANPEIFTSPNLRYKLTSEQDPKKAMHKIFEMEILPEDRKYMVHTLSRETDDVFVPQALIDEITIGHKRHHTQVLMEEKAPKAPFYLVLGPTGSGKTKTINKAIELALFDQDLEMKKADEDLEEIIERHPIMARIDLESVAPEKAAELKKKKRKRFLRWVSGIPFLKRFYKDDIAALMKKEDRQFGLVIDVDQINPNNVQTMWYGETGNKMLESFGPRYGMTIRILEEAHALLSVHKSHSAQVQEDTLVSTFNIILDEIEKGERNCMVFALTRKGEEFHEDIYRRFQEKGRIIDMNDYWNNPETIEELIKIEVKQQDVEMPSENEMEGLSQKVLDIFEYRGLDVTPAYVRKLIASIAEMKGGVELEYLNDGVLVREAFVNVARNLFPSMFKRTYNRLNRGVPWEDYVGGVKEEFQRLANQCLLHSRSAEKGVVLAGPPGTGKTFLARAYLSRNRDISDVTLKMEDLQDERDPIDGPVRRLAEAFDIAKMCAPSLLFVDEGEAVAMERQGNINDRITNKLLNAIDGETELRGVFVALTTNKPEYLAQAATRSGRLKVMPITGKLNERDIYKMIDNYMKDEIMAEDLEKERIYSVAKQICATPADYSKFLETIVNFKNEEAEVMKAATATGDLKQFIASNYKAMLGVIESLGFPKDFVKESRKNLKFLLRKKGQVLDQILEATEKAEFPITIAHLERAKEDRIQAPQLQGKISLDTYLQSQLSSEPQVGFVIGAGASETTGTLVPISTSLIYGEDHKGDKVVVTGAVNVDTPAAAQLNAAVAMMKQSSNEAMSLVLNYLDSLLPGKAINRIVGTYLKDTYLHHQFLTANYQSGGPSAGMALAINTLSVILGLPVRNDFGITGAAWSRGKTTKDVGSVVIIGGTHNKAQIVLSYLDNMYVPQQNVKDVDILTLENYWKQGKDVIGYPSFSSIVGEVYSWGEVIEGKMQELLGKRIEAKQRHLVNVSEAKKLFVEVDRLGLEIREHAEGIIRSRLEAVESHILDAKSDKFASLEHIFDKYSHE